tara:strand:+ start:762 stop:1634 length:873 start_codon:yes stop_codon:yes gene_type:complete
MNWFNIIKVEDIDFDKDIEAFGQYSQGPHEIIDAFEEGDYLGRGKMRDIMIRAMMRGAPPKTKDVVSEQIRINHHQIYKYLVNKLDRKPTEQDIITFIKRIIMHEATHAGMGSEQDSMGMMQAEYGAYTGQFPESVYIRLKEILKHPATERHLLPMELGAALGMEYSEIKRDLPTAKKIEDILSYVDKLTAYLPDGKTKKDAREKLTRLERQAMTQRKDEIAMVKNFTIPILVQRYGEENRAFISNLLQEETPDDIKLASAGGVTTTSAPSMFNNKVVNSRKKKKRKEWA